MAALLIKQECVHLKHYYKHAPRCKLIWLALRPARVGGIACLACFHACITNVVVSQLLRIFASVGGLPSIPVSDGLHCDLHTPSRCVQGVLQLH